MLVKKKGGGFILFSPPGTFPTGPPYPHAPHLVNQSLRDFLKAFFMIFSTIMMTVINNIKE